MKQMYGQGASAIWPLRGRRPGTSESDRTFPMTSTGRVSSLAAANLVRRGDCEFPVLARRSRCLAFCPAVAQPAISFSCTVTQPFVPAPASCTTHCESATAYLVLRSLSLSPNSRNMTETNRIWGTKNAIFFVNWDMD
jgi:hypothetical protein